MGVVKGAKSAKGANKSVSFVLAHLTWYRRSGAFDITYWGDGGVGSGRVRGGAYVGWSTGGRVVIDLVFLADLVFLVG